MCSKKLNDFADFTEDIVNRLSKQLKANENDVKFLWKRGNDILFARNLADQRVQHCWDILKSHASGLDEQKTAKNSSPSSSHPSTSTSTEAPNDVLYSDIWLAETKYSIASARLLQVNEECNKQLKKIFSLGKGLESKRIGLITRAAGNAALPHALSHH